jgi:hypothetical protein
MRHINIYYLSILTTEEMEISSGVTDHKAAHIATCPRYSCGWPMDRPCSFEKLLLGSNGPHSNPRIVACSFFSKHSVRLKGREVTNTYYTATVRADGEVIYRLGMASKSVLKLELDSIWT